MNGMFSNSSKVVKFAKQWARTSWVLSDLGVWQCSQQGVLGAAYACLALGAIGIIKAAQQIGDVRVVGLLSAAIFCGYAYQVSFS